MSKWPMRGHFRYLRFKTFPMTPRTPQCEAFWALLSNPKHSGVPKDSKSPTLEVLGFTPTLGQRGVATLSISDPIKIPRLSGLESTPFDNPPLKAVTNSMKSGLFILSRTSNCSGVKRIVVGCSSSFSWSSWFSWFP